MMSSECYQQHCLLLIYSRNNGTRWTVPPRLFDQGYFTDNFTAEIEEDEPNHPTKVDYDILWSGLLWLITTEQTGGQLIEGIHNTGN